MNVGDTWDERQNVWGWEAGNVWHNVILWRLEADREVDRT